MNKRKYKELRLYLLEIFMLILLMDNNNPPLVQN